MLASQWEWERLLVVKRFVAEVCVVCVGGVMAFFVFFVSANIGWGSALGPVLSVPFYPLFCTAVSPLGIHVSSL